MKIYFGENKENRILIGENEGIEKCFETINKYIKDNNLYSAPYRRQWMYEDELIIDYGSHINFFYISGN